MRRVSSAQRVFRVVSTVLPPTSSPGFATLRTPVAVRDRHDPRIGHLIGLSFQRAAACANRQHTVFDDRQEGPLLLSASQHAKDGLAQMMDSGYGGSHWLASFALYLFLPTWDCPNLRRLTGKPARRAEIGCAIVRSPNGRNCLVRRSRFTRQKLKDDILHVNDVVASAIESGERQQQYAAGPLIPPLVERYNQLLAQTAESEHHQLERTVGRMLTDLRRHASSLAKQVSGQRAEKTADAGQPFAVASTSGQRLSRRSAGATQQAQVCRRW